jgi:hypothetical protein
METKMAARINSKPKSLPRLCSSTVKTAVLSHFRFDERWVLFSTEASLWHADILMVDSNDWLVEFEVKISISDLKADFEKPKHKSYKLYRGKGGMVPNRLYFAMPKNIASKAKEILAPHPAYGIIAVDETDRKVEVFKKAGFIHKFHKATEKAKRTILLRMGSELIDLRRRRDKENPEEDLRPLEEDILDLSPYVINPSPRRGMRQDLMMPKDRMIQK